jgi:hypothetical protein
MMFDYHHRNPLTKEFAISNHHQGRKSRKAIIEEIEKCDIVCCRCHRKIERGIQLIPYDQQYLG